MPHDDALGLDVRRTAFGALNFHSAITRKRIQLATNGATARVLRSLADLKSETLAVMRGSSYHGDCGSQLTRLACARKDTFDHA